MKKMHRKTMRGTVLFTTVAVMALMIIFLMGTLVLASASNSRAHKSYSTSQASYTARTAVESFTTAMQREGGIAAAVQELSQSGANSKKLVDITLNDPSLGKVGYIDDNGEFQQGKILIENIGGNEYEYIADNGQSVAKADSAVSNAKWVKLDRVKITATCQVGKEEETVSAYVVKKNGSATQTGGGNTSVKGIQMVGAAGLPNGKNVTGGLGVNLSSVSDDAVTKMRNNMEISTSLSFFNSSLVWNTTDTNIDIKERNGSEIFLPYSQTIVNGNLYVNNNNLITLGYAADPAWSNKEIPYIYIDGLFVNKSGIDVVKSTNNDARFNFFAGTLVTNENTMNFANTNIYLMDKYDATKTDDYYTVYTDTVLDQTNSDNLDKPDVIKGKSPLSNERDKSLGNKFRKGDNYLGYSSTSKLEAWSDSLTTGTNANIGIGGTVFCNGKLHLKQIEIGGDVRVEGDCVIEDNVTIKGNLYVGGTISGSGADSIDSSKKFTDHPTVESKAATFKEVDNIAKMGESEKTNYDKVERKAYYLKWDPTKHQRTLDDEAHSIVNVDMWGNTVDQPTVIYYKWKDDVQITEDRLNKANLINSEVSYNDLEINAAFDEFRNDVYFMKYYDITIEPNESQENITGDSDENGRYYNAVPVATDNGVVASGKRSETTYYEHKENHSVISQEDYDNLSGVVEGYWRAKMDGTSSGQDADMNPKTYYINDDPSRWTYDYDEATKALVTYATAASPLPQYMTAIYPTEMLRENIYGTHSSASPDGSGFIPASNQTKIVTTLTEARKALGLSPKGDIDSDKYPSDFPEANAYPVAVNNSWDMKTDNADIFGMTALDKDGNSHKAISANCIIKGTIDTDIYIKPKSTQPIYILLDDVLLQNGHKIVVDHEVKKDSEGHSIILDGEVIFIVKGKVEARASGAGIYTTDFIKRTEYDYTQDWGVIYYAEKGGDGSDPRIVTEGEVTFVGCFRTPTMKFIQGGNGGAYTKDYTGEDGQHYKDIAPVIVGNALFDKVYGNNSVTNHYTASGGGGGTSGTGIKTIITDVGFFEIQYMLGG